MKAKVFRIYKTLKNVENDHISSFEVKTDNIQFELQCEANNHKEYKRLWAIEYINGKRASEPIYLKN